MTMVAALNDMGDMDDVFAVQDIEYEFGCTIPDDFYTDGTTFGDFVECVKAGRGKVQPQTEKATAGGWLSCLGVWGMILWAVIKRRKGPDPRITKM